PLRIAAADWPILPGVARARPLAWFQVPPARLVRPVAAGEPISAIAARLEWDPATVWRVGRRSALGGLKALRLDEPRLGRPQSFPPGTYRGADGVCLSRARHGQPAVFPGGSHREEGGGGRGQQGRGALHRLAESVPPPA